MKSNKEIKEKLNIDKKHFVTIEDIEGVSFTLKEWNQLKSEILQKIKELEKDRDDLWGKGGELLSENIELKGLLKDSQKEIEIEQTEKFKSRNWASSLLDEQNKLESQLQEQRNKIKERIEELSKKKYHYVIKITDDKGIELKKSIKEYHKAGTLDWCENCKAIEELKSLLGEKE